MSSSSYILPALDQEFLLGDTTRGIRFMLEYMKAEEHLRDWGIRTTVVAFGSARVKEDDEGKRDRDRMVNWLVAYYNQVETLKKPENPNES